MLAYTGWVNAQLKKKPGSRSVESLRTDLRDGTVLADLIEILGKHCCVDVFNTQYFVNTFLFIPIS